MPTRIPWRPHVERHCRGMCARSGRALGIRKCIPPRIDRFTWPGARPQLSPRHGNARRRDLGIARRNGASLVMTTSAGTAQSVFERNDAKPTHVASGPVQQPAVPAFSNTDAQSAGVFAPLTGAFVSSHTFGFRHRHAYVLCPTCRRFSTCGLGDGCGGLSPRLSGSFGSYLSMTMLSACHVRMYGGNSRHG
jgi:hypothetical protein